MIRAQSLAGYFATLGGGYFMCHHWQTAVKLAQYQQQMAMILGDTGMIYKCILNQAYNYIYAGQFMLAYKWIHYVFVRVQGRDEVLANMCRSAHLFAKRVFELHRTSLGNDKLESKSRTVDDYARVRIVRDRSSKDDKLVV
jgi:hypothetical protein